MARPKRKIVTDQASNDEVAPLVKPRPRKKQAVTKTNSAAVKALIRKNASTSPLLLLPSEVRENILIHLLGNELIHVKYLILRELGRSNSAESEQLSNHTAADVSGNGDDHDDYVHASLTSAPATHHIEREAFRHAICIAKHSEQSAYDAFVSGDADVPEGESPEHYVASCRERHAVCKMCGDGPMALFEGERRALRLDLSVLGVCRQLYEEGNHLLWATNTFSFEDPRTFGKFVGSLNPAQKRNLARIHIGTDLGRLSTYYTTTYQRARHDDSYWGSGLKIPNLNMLRGVQTLHLCINQTFEGLPRINGNLSNEELIETNLEADVQIILRLRALSLKHVTVVVSDDPARLKKWERTDLRWTAVRKAEYAESIRARLVDPNGAELVKAEAEAANLARKIEIRDNAADRLITYKSTLKEKRADVIRTAKRASREEAKAELAAEELAQTSSKSLKMPLKDYMREDWTLKITLGEDADKLNADKLKKDALDARTIADVKARQEKFWQEKVANGREKLKRAMAQLGATPEGIEYEEELEKLMESSSGSEMDDVKSDDTDDTDDDFFSW